MKKKIKCPYVLLPVFMFWHSRFSFRNLKDANSCMFSWCITTSSLLICSWHDNQSLISVFLCWWFSFDLQYYLILGGINNVLHTSVKKILCTLWSLALAKKSCNNINNSRPQVSRLLFLVTMSLKNPSFSLTPSPSKQNFWTCLSLNVYNRTLEINQWNSAHISTLFQNKRMPFSFK